MNEPEIDPNDTALEDASEATIQGSIEVMRRLWDTPEEDAAWKYLENREYGTV